MKKIVVVGSSNTDLIIKVPELPRPGETLLGGEFMTFPGGKGANQAVAAARAGGEVVFIAAVGDDPYGEEAIKGYALMKKYGFHQMRHAFGFLKELISFSIAKLERHITLCRETESDQAPEYELESYDPEGLEAIKRNGSRANYMQDDHTLKNTGKSFIY